LELKKAAIEAEKKTSGDRPILGEIRQSEADNFYFT
jgi:hypothetical protein